MIHNIPKVEQRQTFYGYVKQDGMYTTLDLLITDEYSKEYSDYYKNSKGWYMSKSSFDLKEVIHHLWKTYCQWGDKKLMPIKLNLEDIYLIEWDTIKKLFAEELI